MGDRGEGGGQAPGGVGVRKSAQSGARAPASRAHPRAVRRPHTLLHTHTHHQPMIYSLVTVAIASSTRGIITPNSAARASSRCVSEFEHYNPHLKEMRHGGRSRAAATASSRPTRDADRRQAAADDRHLERRGEPAESRRSATRRRPRKVHLGRDHVRRDVLPEHGRRQAIHDRP